MVVMSPETIWGDDLELVDKNGSADDYFNLRLKSTVTDDDKYSFECYVMQVMGGEYFLKEMYPEMKDPYYTWEGKVVERSSLKGRQIPLAEKVPPTTF